MGCGASADRRFSSRSLLIPSDKASSVDDHEHIILDSCSWFRPESEDTRTCYSSGCEPSLQRVPAHGMLFPNPSQTSPLFTSFHLNSRNDLLVSARRVMSDGGSMENWEYMMSSSLLEKELSSLGWKDSLETFFDWISTALGSDQCKGKFSDHDKIFEVSVPMNECLKPFTIHLRKVKSDPVISRRAHELFLMDLVRSNQMLRQANRRASIKSARFQNDGNLILNVNQAKFAISENRKSDQHSACLHSPAPFNSNLEIQCHRNNSISASIAALSAEDSFIYTDSPYNHKLSNSFGKESLIDVLNSPNHYASHLPLSSTPAQSSPLPSMLPALVPDTESVVSEDLNREPEESLNHNTAKADKSSIVVKFSCPVSGTSRSEDEASQTNVKDIDGASTSERAPARKVPESFSSTDCDDFPGIRLPINSAIIIIDSLIRRFSDSSEITTELRFIRKILQRNELFSPNFIMSQVESDEEVNKFVSGVIGTRTSMQKILVQSIEKQMSVFGAIKVANRLKKKASQRLALKINPGDPVSASVIASTICSWKYNVFDVANSTGRPLFYTAMAIIHKYNLLNKLNIVEDKFFNFLMECERVYASHSNPYHNNLHAADVLQTLYFFISHGSFDDFYDEWDLFAAFFAAIIHDLDHPGVSNKFLSKSLHEIAIKFSDQSLCEMHHLSSAFHLLSQDEFDFTKEWDRDRYFQFRDTVINLVLSTDMTKHYHLLGRFSVMALQSDGPFNHEDRQSTLLLLQILMKCADVSNPAKPPDISRIWTDRVMEEFHLQGDQEKRLGMETSPFCDRDKPNRAKCQVAFIDFIVKPLYLQLANFAPIFSTCVRNIDENRTYWIENSE